MRYTPHEDAYTTGDPYDILKSPNGVHEFLILGDTDMTFTWSSSAAGGDQNAAVHFPYAEGIDVHNRILN